ncbi:hypothetical protein [Embleya sp. NPDC020630]|uniref:hypothetical protein n=1 Tax=Embleya sp. NPDC020630 TaxID=3363979 RepID=UPI0037A5E423
MLIRQDGTQEITMTLRLGVTGTAALMELATAAAVAAGRDLDIADALMYAFENGMTTLPQPDDPDRASASALPGAAPETAAPFPSPVVAAAVPTTGVPSQGSPDRALTSAARRDPRVLALADALERDRDLTGAEVGRRLGLSGRTGQRLLNEAATEVDARHANAHRGHGPGRRGSRQPQR